MDRYLLAILVHGVAACADPVEPASPSFANQIVFLSSETGVWRLYSMDLDGSDRRSIPIPLTGHLADPDVSPDGLKLAFSHFDTRAIYTVRPDGSDLERIGSEPGRDIGHVDFQARWSPDGTELAFSSGRDGLGINLYVIRADGSDLRQLTFGEDLRMGSWSPDGLRLAFTIVYETGPRVAHMNRDGSDRVELPPLNAIAPDWSPDGSEIAYDALDDDAIHVIGVDGSDDRRVSRGSFDAQPRWSPDGTRLLFVNINNAGITVSRTDGSERRQLSLGSDSGPEWGPTE